MRARTWVTAVALRPVPDTSESADNMISPRPIPVLMLKLSGIIRIVRMAGALT